MKRGFFLALVALAVVAQPVVAATTMTGADAINEDADAAHNPYVDGDVTKSVHEMGWAPLEYEDNNGDLVEHDGMLNDSVENPYAFTFSDVETAAYGEFPVNSQTEDVDSALNATGWTSESGISASDATTAPNVEAVQVSTSSNTGTVSATFDGFKITSDAEKRVAQVVFDVNSIDAGADVFIRFKDTDGDYVEAEIDPDDDASTGNTAANSTGDGYVFQQRVGEMTVTNNGDGTMGAINSTVVVVDGADADISIAALNVERTSPWTLGDERVDSDGDDDLETEPVEQVNQSGDVALHSLESMGPVFDAATVHDLTVPFVEYAGAEDAPSDGFERFNATYSEAADYPSFAWLVDDRKRFAVETAYDLSYANLELRDEVELPSSRYQSVEYATGVGETNFSDISWTDASSSYSNQGDEVTLATGISAGTELAFAIEYPVTQAEYDAITAASGGGAPMGDSGGGLGSIPLIGGALVALLSFLGLRDGGSGGA